MSEMNENYCLRMVAILTSKIKQKETTMNLHTVSCFRCVSLNERSLNNKSDHENLMILLATENSHTKYTVLKLCIRSEINVANVKYYEND